jgi:lipopolysaccharide biosynthesis regulator YciM
MFDNVVTFDEVIMYTLDRAEEKFSEGKFWRARGWHERAVELYRQNPTKNKEIEARLHSLMDDFFLRYMG